MENYPILPPLNLSQNALVSSGGRACASGIKPSREAIGQRLVIVPDRSPRPLPAPGVAPGVLSAPAPAAISTLLLEGSRRTEEKGAVEARKRAKADEELWSKLLERRVVIAGVPQRRSRENIVGGPARIKAAYPGSSLI